MFNVVNNYVKLEIRHACVLFPILLEYCWSLAASCVLLYVGTWHIDHTLTKNIAIMSGGELLVKLKLVKAQTDATVELLSNTAALRFSLDDEYEADYLVSCLESNSEKLYALAKKCRSAVKSGQQEQKVVTEQTGRLLSASVSSAVDSSCVNQPASQSPVKAADVDSDDTASMDSSDVSTPLCGDTGNVSIDQTSN